MSNYRIEKDPFKYNFYYTLKDGKKIYYDSETCIYPQKTNIWRNLSSMLERNKDIHTIDIEIDETSGNS